MNNLLIYILKSTVCLSLLYLLYRTTMRKETSFSVNRVILLLVVVISAIIPLLTLPDVMQFPSANEISPLFDRISTNPERSLTQQPIEISNTQLTEKSVLAELKTNGNFSIHDLIQYTYIIGLFISLFSLLVGLARIFSLFRNARWIKMEGYKVLIVDRDISAFSFSRYIILSGTDYEEHQTTLLAHEQAHIKLLHFYDLALLGFAKIVHWFNPFIYLLLKDLKEVHEFQADDYTLTKGIDATQYQLLIIQKGVGSHRFALANSFNYCQIKKRIAMINEQKPRKAWNWKVATFLPVLALLLMAFGRQSERAMDFKEAQNPIKQKSEEKQSLGIGIGREQLSEYENIVNKVIDNKGVPDVSKISDSDKKKLETLYLSMNAEQRAAQIVIFIPAPPPLPKSVPTIEQMKTWEDSKIYGLWINEKRVNNSELKNYTHTDFSGVFVSKLEKNTVNYGKHYYQVNLMTNQYYTNYLAKRELEDKYGIAVRKKKEATLNPVDKIYKIADVDEKPVFTEGEINNWLSNRLTQFGKNRPDGWNYSITYSMVIDRNGKVADAKIIKGCNYPEIEAEFRKALDLMPVWKPGKKNGEPVSVQLYQAYAVKVKISPAAHKDSLLNYNQIIRTKLSEINPQNTPILYLDGVRIDQKRFRAINSDSVKFVDLLKGTAYTDQYGDSAKNGIVAIVSVKKWENIKPGENTIYFVDGIETSSEKFKAISPNSIENFSTLKGEQAIQKYGDRAKSGVVEVKLKHAK